MDYKLTVPIEIDGYANADGIYVNDEGAWLGSVELARNEDGVHLAVWPYSDEDGDYIPAPANWEKYAEIL